ncbi:conserved hypothetical protein [Planktothrix serta PCC 8927]|uniref:Thylakoid-associated protein n=1 Tax=Planktothrix serta PCC 8927 TaxID=671068 RepID=A0A7Z9DXN1_9CYAN|nr:hypothetical protein [Planktothrix serta]VXD11530.1 conserved hypothetical protein [Planktothrix serta PCC 8927]
MNLNMMLESPKMLLNFQKKAYDSWVANFGFNPNSVNPFDWAEKTLTLQQDLIQESLKETLKAQEVISQTAILTQQQLWDNYFGTLQKMGIEVIR